VGSGLAAVNDAVLNGLRLDRGLTEILHAGTQGAPALPQQHQLDPAESLAAPALDTMLGPAGLDAELEAALTPNVDDRALLLPAAFRGALEQARASLAQAATQAAEPALQRLLQAAVRTLDDDLALRDLAAMYRGLLHQG
jgi:hypothetical protein